MKRGIFNKNIIKIGTVLILLDIIGFILTVILSMGDETPTPITADIITSLEYILGFPLIIIKANWLLFLVEGTFHPLIIILMALLNNYVFALIINMFVRSIKRRKIH